MEATATPKLHFPNAVTMTNFLLQHELLNQYYCQQRDLTETVINLAVARFAGEDKVEQVVNLGAFLIVNDLQNGYDGFTGERLRTVEKMTGVFWNQFRLILESALIDCATKANKE